MSGTTNHKQARTPPQLHNRLDNDRVLQRTLGHMNPLRKLKEWYAEHPESFRKRVYNQSGPGTGEESASSSVPVEAFAEPEPLTADRWARMDGDPECYAIHMDAHGDLLGISQALCQRLGFRPADLAGAPVAALLHPDHRHSSAAQRILVGRTGELVELAFSEQRLPDGEVLWLSRAPEPEPGAETSTPEEGLHRLLDHLTDAILLLASNGRVRYINPAAASLLEPGGEGVGRHWQELLPVDGRTGAMVARCLAEGEGGEQTLTLGTGSRKRHVALACFPFAGGSGADGTVIRLATGRGAGLDEEIIYRARHDAVTGLHNRWEFESRLNEQLQRVGERSSDPLTTLALLDLDQFKTVNDNVGHAAGDALLRRVASTLAARLRAGDVLARLGGDEFAVLLPGCEPEAAAGFLREILTGITAEPFCFDGQQFTIGVSVGIAPLDGDDPCAVLTTADRACYRAKAAGRGRVTVATEAIIPSG